LPQVFIRQEVETDLWGLGAGDKRETSSPDCSRSVTPRSFNPYYNHYTDWATIIIKRANIKQGWCPVWSFETWNLPQQYFKIQSEALKTQRASITETNWLMLLKEIITVYFFIVRAIRNAYIPWQNAEFLNFKASGSCSKHWILKGWQRVCDSSLQWELTSDVMYDKNTISYNCSHSNCRMQHSLRATEMRT
jgi:hypothetical protein